MTNLTIYDSHGNPYGDGGSVRSNERIEEFFFGGVKLYLDTGSRTELVVFFRARESNVGRAEQFYAVYETRDTRNLFENFKSELRHRVETEYGMTIEASSDDVRVYELLGDRNTAVPGSEFDRTVVSKLLRSGNRLRFGVRTASEALGLCSEYLGESAGRVAIADKTSIDALEDCDLAVEVGTYDGLEPLGETRRLVDDQRRSMEGQLINEKITTVKEEIGDLRSKTTKSDEEIRNRLKRQISIFETPPPPSANDGPLDALPDLSRPQKIAGGVVGVVVLLALVSVMTTALLGVPAPLADALGFADDGDGSAADESDVALEGVTVAGTEIANIDGRQTVSLSDGELNVTGETNRNAVRITFSPDGDGDGGESVAEPDVEDGSFEATLSDLESGSGELVVEAGTSDDGEFEAEITETVALELEADASLGNLSVNGQSFGEFEADETAAVTLSDGNLTVDGTTNREAVRATFTPDSEDGDETESAPVTVDENGSFEVGLSDLDPASGELLVEAGTNGDEFESEITETVALELEAEPTLGNLSVNDQSFEELEDRDEGSPMVTLSDGNLTVDGTTNREAVRATFTPDSADGDETESDPVTVDENDSFEVELSDFEPASGELLVEAGTNDDEFESEINESVAIELEAEPTLGNFSVNGQSSEELEGDETATVTLSDGNLTVDGTTNREVVRATFTPDSEEGDKTESDPVTVDEDDSFEVELSDLEPASGELLVEAGTNDDEFESEINESVAIELEAEPTLGNLSVNGQSFEELEADETATVTLSDGNLTVDGTTNQEAVTVSFDGNKSGVTSTPEPTDVEDGSFEAELSGLEPDSGELVVRAGSTDENDEIEEAEANRLEPLQLESSDSD